MLVSTLAASRPKIVAPGPPDVVSHVWTPTKNGGGNILDASWANLPLNEWCAVAGTKTGQLSTLLTAAGLPRATIEKGDAAAVAGGMVAWSGCVLAGTSAYWPVPGGHVDSSMNGLWRLDLERMGSDAGFAIECNPSDPADATYPWDAGYIARSMGSFRIYPPSPSGDGVANDILPDGKPTSRHQYKGIWYDSTRNQVGVGTMSRWVWDLDTDAWTRTRWTYSGSPVEPTINQHLFYHAATDQIVGYFARLGDGDYYTMSKTAASGSAIVDITPPTNWFAQSGAASCRLSEDEVLFLWWNNDVNEDRWAILNLSSASVTSQGLVTNPIDPGSTNNEMQVCVYNPTTGKVLRRLTDGSFRGDWYEFDLATKANSVHTPAGFAVPYAPTPGGNCFHYAARNCIVYVAPADGSGVASDTVDAVHVLRYA